MSSRLVAIFQTLAMLLASALVGVLAKVVLREVDPFTFVWLQVSAAGSVLSLYTFGLRGERIPRALGREIWLLIAGIGVLNFGLVRWMHLLALEKLPATTYAYLLSFVGIVTMAMSAVLLKERPSLLSVLGALLALAGLWIFFDEIPPPEELLGVVYVMIAVLGLAIYNTLARKLGAIAPTHLSNNIVSTVALWIGGVPLVLAGLCLDWPPQVSGWTNWTIIVLNGVVGIAIGLTVFNHVLRTLRAYEASILASAGVIYIALFAYPILGERLDLHQILGIAMMILGLAMVQIRGSAEGSAGRGD